jgi:cytochrome c-type biogenesis protein CcmE
VELTPRALDDDDVTVEEGEVAPRASRSRRRRTRRRWLPLVVLAVVVLGLGALVYKGLNDATMYFRNADEAVAQRDDLGTKRFRLQGTVVGEPTVDGDDVRFAVAYNGVEVQVDHSGTPPDMFRQGIPVVLEGHWNPSGAVFDSDRMLIKHDESYESQDDYQERIHEAEQGGEAGQGTTGAGSSG